MIYYIAHWDWILKNSRSDIAKVVDFEVKGVAPLKDFKKDLKEDRSVFLDRLKGFPRRLEEVGFRKSSYWWPIPMGLL